MSASRRVDRTGTRGFAHLIEIKVPVARVWRALTDAALVRIWSGGEAEIDARKGGIYRIGKVGAGGREAHIDVFEANRRLRLIYLPNRESPASDSAIVDDFLLDVRKGHGTTSLRLLGSGIPEAEAWDKSYVRLRVGWERLLGRIKMTLENPPVPKKKRTTIPDAPLAGLDY